MQKFFPIPSLFAPDFTVQPDIWAASAALLPQPDDVWRSVSLLWADLSPDLAMLGWLLFFLSLIGHVLHRLTARQALQQSMMYDKLTGLPNRMLFEDHVRQTIRLGQRRKNNFAVIMADLDRFQQINETLGHHAGDALLKEASRRIRSLLRNSDILARLGDDEFACLLFDIPDATVTTKVMERMLHAMDEPIYVDGLPFHVGLSMGAVLHSADGGDVETLLRQANTALHRAKDKKNCFVFYDSNADEHSRKTIQLQNDLRNAIRQNALEVYYQPKIHCGSHNLKGVEALARWNHPEQGMISPMVFIPLAKKNGMIKELTLLILQKSIMQISRLYHQGVEVSLAVNIAQENLEDVSFPGELLNLLSCYNFPPRCLELEITEDVIISNIQNALQVTHQLHEHGVRISIDDFGTGNSSIAYLKKLPIQTLKIDLSFIREMNRSPSDAAIVKTTILLSKSLGLSVVAEGVEDELTLQKLNDWGCDLAQGYYVCKPIPNDALLEWVDQTSQWKPQRRELKLVQPVSPDHPPELKIVRND